MWNSGGTTFLERQSIDLYLLNTNSLVVTSKDPQYFHILALKFGLFPSDSNAGRHLGSEAPQAFQGGYGSERQIIFVISNPRKLKKQTMEGKI